MPNTSGRGSRSRHSAARLRPVAMPSLADSAWNSIAITLATTTTHSSVVPYCAPAWMLVAKLPGSI